MEDVAFKDISFLIKEILDDQSLDYLYRRRKTIKKTLEILKRDGRIYSYT